MYQSVNISAVASEARHLIAEVRNNKSMPTTEAQQKMARAKELSEKVKAHRDQQGKDLELAIGDTEKALGSGIVSGNLGNSHVGFGGRETRGLNEELTITHAAAEALGMDVKALSEGSSTAGGYLVPPQYANDLFAPSRRQGNSLRSLGWLAIKEMESTPLYIPRANGAAAVGWVAENATKPNTDQTFAQIAVNGYTLAGITKLSRQLVQDSGPAIVDLAFQELATQIGNGEEVAILNGSGTGQPRGILNTAGVPTIPLTTATAAATLDAILDAITSVRSSYYSGPTGILMHPRRFAVLAKAKDSAGRYLLDPPQEANTNAVASLWGIPVGLSTNVPTNLGAGTNQDAIFVADWTQALFFQREQLNVVSTQEAGTAFETNQQWIRVEERVGFTAERYPAAFAVISGSGLVAP